MENLFQKNNETMHNRIAQQDCSHATTGRREHSQGLELVRQQHQTISNNNITTSSGYVINKLTNYKFYVTHILYFHCQYAVLS